MKLKNLLRTWEGVQAENKWNRIFIALLLVALIVLLIQVFNKDTVVTIQPYTLTDEAWVTSDESSSSYKEAWGWAVATLLGNVTPSNVDFIKERLSPILSPRIYNDVIDALEMQAREIKVDRVTMRFEPRFIEYEHDSGKVFVYGNSFVRGVARSGESRGERTYEFDIAISNYLPVIDHMSTYEGRPKTTSVLQRLQQREERAKERSDR